jgi:ribonuclease HII
VTLRVLAAVLESRKQMSRLCSSHFERAARKLGWTRIAGLDEAGRGALFGPVVAAAVILNPRRRIVGLDDSKKLTPERRAELAPRIREHAIAWAVAEVDAQRIDAWNIYQASRQAMTAALQQLSIVPDYLLIDAMELDVFIEQKSLIKGDTRSVSIAAASILAKTHRDTRMEEWDAVFPQYGLARHKGYATPDHLEALRQFGPSPLHRHSFAPVRDSACWAANATQTILPLGI